MRKIKSDEIIKTSAEWSVIWNEKDKKWRNIQNIGEWSVILNKKDKKEGNIQNIGWVVSRLIGHSAPLVTSEKGKWEKDRNLCPLKRHEYRAFEGLVRSRLWRCIDRINCWTDYCNNREIIVVMILDVSKTSQNNRSRWFKKIITPMVMLTP